MNDHAIHRDQIGKKREPSGNSIVMLIRNPSHQYPIRPRNPIRRPKNRSKANNARDRVNKTKDVLHFRSINETLNQGHFVDGGGGV